MDDGTLDDGKIVQEYIWWNLMKDGKKIGEKSSETLDDGKSKKKLCKIVSTPRE